MIEVKSVIGNHVHRIPFAESNVLDRLILLFKKPHFMPIETTGGTDMVIEYKTLSGVPFYIGTQHSQAENTI